MLLGFLRKQIFEKSGLLKATKLTLKNLIASAISIVSTVSGTVKAIDQKQKSNTLKVFKHVLSNFDSVPQN